MSVADHKAVADAATPASRWEDPAYRECAELIERRTGLRVPPERRGFLIGQLGERMRELGCVDADEYRALLQSGPDAAREWATLTDRLTVHETRFFRHGPSLALVREHLIPRLAAVREDLLQVRAWSVGCATGEEAYTLAMILDECRAARGDGYHFGVTGTDISAAALSTARAASYPANRTAGLPAALRDTYMIPEREGRYRVCEHLRQRVCFARMNALEPEAAPVGEMDLIYCQNLLMYFSRARRVEIVHRLIRRLRPGGLLVLGPGELVGWSHPALERIDHAETLAYERKACGIARAQQG